MKRLLIPVLVLAALAAGWFARQSFAPRAAVHPPQSGERRVKFYQSPMHPWIKSEQPGKCTICGMDLTPVYEGDAGIEAVEGIVSLSSNQVTVVQVQTSEVSRRTLSRTLRVAGSIDDNDQRHRVLAAYTGGRVDKLFVNYLGAEVTEGQPLAAFYSPMLLTAAREYLALTKGGSPAPLSGNSLHASAALRLRQLGLTDAQVAALPTTFSETNLHVEIVAPMTGTVVAKDVYEGQYVEEGMKLFELADFSTMWFLFDAYEQDLAWIRPGQTVEISTPSLPGHVFTNVVTFVDPNFREETRTAKARVEIPNPLVEEGGQQRRLIRHRLYASGRVQSETPIVLTVPRTAVLSPGEQPVVYVERGNGSYEQRRVKLGRAGDTAWEVLDGVSEGERVVTSGNLLIDAQAQLNTAVQGTTHQHGAAAPSHLGQDRATLKENLMPLSPAQVTTLNDFLAFADRLRESLSADNLKSFNELAPQLHAVVPKLVSALEGNHAWHALAEKLRPVSHLDPAPDLAAARKQFHAFSVEVVALAKQLRGADPTFTRLKVFQCPMTKRAFPGAPPRAEWLQLGGAIRNPYFGTEMLDCGTEVKP
jgi:Cu(I)/Ag(I) efflux system membrane fusion protein